MTPQQLSDPKWCLTNAAVLYDAGYSIRNLVALTGCSYGKVRTALIAQGAVMRSPGGQTRPISSLSAAYLADIEACARAVAAGTHAEELAHRLAAEDVPALMAELAKIRTRASRQTARLGAAEAVCALFGVTGSHLDTDREKALHELWGAWSDLRGADTTPISEERVAELARLRDIKRAEALRKLRALELGTREHEDPNGRHMAGGPW